MKKLSLIYIFLLSLCLCGCSTTGDKSLNITIVYAITTCVSLAIMINYFKIIKDNRDNWFILLLGSVLVVNIGYLTLSSSTTLQHALFANRISYLGSVFLPMSMFMSIVKVSGIHYNKKLPALLCCICLIVFVIAASPGYSTIYYKEVSLVIVNGAAVLDKTYGPLHIIYMFYLIIYFLMMIFIVIYASKKKYIQDRLQAMIIIIAVFANIVVWLIGQNVKINFEFLSVSYIFSELFLISLYILIQDINKQKNEILNLKNIKNKTSEPSLTNEEKELISIIQSGIEKLTPTEYAIYCYYIEGKSTKEVLELLNIKENTLKYHNKNIYSKLGVSSRKQIVKLSKHIKPKEL